jgi:hypothetical protein
MCGGRENIPSGGGEISADVTLGWDVKKGETIKKRKWEAKG